MADERWLPVVGWEGWYEVSDLGRVRRVAPSRGRKPVDGVLKLTIGYTGYPQVCLTCPGRKQRAHKVHNLVLAAFVGPRPHGMEARHLNGDPLDAGLTNLAWGTPTENQADKILHGTTNRGERNGHAKLTAADVLEMRRAHRAGEKTSHQLTEEYGLFHHYTLKLLRGGSWRHLNG